MSLIAASLLVAASGIAQTPEPPARSVHSIAVLDAKAASPADAPTAAIFTRALTQATAKASKAKVIAADEVRGLLDAKAAQALTGCEDERCSTAAFSSVLAVDELVLARVGTLGDRVLAFVSLVDVKSATVVARASTSFPRPTAGAPSSAAAIAAAVETAAGKLWSDVAEQNGDRVLASLRIAPVFDEAVARSAEGAAAAPSEKLRAVEACVQDQLLSAGVALVAPDAVAVLKGDAARAQWIAGTAPPFIDSHDVDAVLVSRVEYSAGGAFAGAERVDADLALRLVLVDTGTIVASKTLRASASGFNANAARKEAAKKLCADVKPVLAQALAERRALGNRVVVDVTGGFGAGDVDALTALFQRVKSVTRVRVARFDEHSATAELVVAGGDGLSVALALLALPTTGPSVAWQVTSAEPSVLRLAR